MRSVMSKSTQDTSFAEKLAELCVRLDPDTGDVVGEIRDMDIRQNSAAGVANRPSGAELSPSTPVLHACRTYEAYGRYRPEPAVAGYRLYSFGNGPAPGNAQSFQTTNPSSRTRQRRPKRPKLRRLLPPCQRASNGPTSIICNCLNPAAQQLTPTALRAR